MSTPYSVHVRAETEADHSAVFALQSAAFGQAGEARLVDVLRRSADPQISLVAEVEGHVRGHVFLSPVSVEGQAPAVSCAGLAPLGVAPDFQGGGVGSALMRAALAECEPHRWAAVFLLGNPAYYSRFGFVLAAPRGFHYESESFDAGFQVLELQPGVLAGASGFVRYHAAFSEL